VRADADGSTLAAVRKCPSNAFTGKVVWITGASSGIGRGLAEEFSALGARVILSARREGVLQQVKASLPTECVVLPLDLEELATIDSKCKEALAAFGHIDILVNNGGISTRALARESPLEVDERLMRLNFIAQVAITKGVLPAMIARKSGHIVNISSVAGKLGANLRSAYCASKFAMIGFFDALRMEELENNIRVTNICPGSVQTDVSRNALGSDGKPLGGSDDNIENGLSVERVAKLITAATWAGLDECWMAKHPELLFVYLMQYAPTVARSIQRKTAKKMEEKTMASIARHKKQA